jgi:hypothetical protein
MCAWDMVWKKKNKARRLLSALEVPGDTVQNGNDKYGHLNEARLGS